MRTRDEAWKDVVRGIRRVVSGKGESELEWAMRRQPMAKLSRNNGRGCFEAGVGSLRAGPHCDFPAFLAVQIQIYKIDIGSFDGILD